jgi:leucyl/phenylalanyl-tRNA--protein transferase
MTMESYGQPWFPPVSKANPDGLLMVGGDLSPSWLLTAYRRGIFPWPVFDGSTEILAWFSPDPRAVLDFQDLHVPRRLQRRIRSGQFRVTLNQAFDEVVDACAAPRKQDEQTWITPRMSRAYRKLHRLGWAHSVEVWQQRSLVGGLYGVAVGGFFSGESMFHRQRDASKAAVVALVEHLRACGFRLFDVQQASPHLRRLGAREIPRSEFLRRLRGAVNLTVRFLPEN